jgi:transcription antitermination factor NusG
LLENSPAWFALHVKPRHEFLVQGDLTRNGLEVYLPTVDKLSQWKDRKKLVEFPLFPGYLFSRVLPVSDHFLELVKTRGVVRILSAFPGRPTPVPEREITALKALLASDQELDIHPELQSGKAVRIKKGVFENVTGIISKRGEQLFLHVNITMLGRCVTVRVFASDVELI